MFGTRHVRVKLSGDLNFKVCRARRAFVGTYLPCCGSRHSSSGSGGDMQTSASVYYTRTTAEVTSASCSSSAANRTRMSRATTIVANDREHSVRLLLPQSIGLPNSKARCRMFI